MIVIDEKKIFEIIEKRNPTSVALNGPDGLLHKVQDLALRCWQKIWNSRICSCRYHMGYM